MNNCEVFSATFLPASASYFDAFQPVTKVEMLSSCTLAVMNERLNILTIKSIFGTTHSKK